MTDTDFLEEDAILKEVWNTEGIEAKTDLNVAQIEAINKSSSFAQAFNNQFLKDTIRHLLILQKSKERKSMGEFVQGIQGKASRIVDRGRNYMNQLFG